MVKILFVAQIVVSIAIVILILLQERSSGIGSSFGGGNEFFQTRRGLEKIVFWATAVAGIAFGALAIADHLIS